MARHVKQTEPLDEGVKLEKEAPVEAAPEEDKEKTIEQAPAEETPAEPAVEENEGNELRSEIRARTAPEPKKSRGISPALLIILLVIAVGAGIGGGYLISRRNEPVPPAELPEIADLTGVEVGEVEWEDEDAFSETLDDEQVDALSDLAGLNEGVEWDDIDAITALDDLDFEGVEEPLEVEGEPVVVAEYDGGTIMSDEAVDAFNEAYTVAALFGGDPDSLTMEEVLRSLVGDRLTAARAKELESTLTEEERAAFKTEAEESYSDLKSMVAADLVENDEMTQEAADAEAEKELKETGVTQQSLEEELITSELSDRLLADTVADVKVDENEVKRIYDERLAKQKADFEAVPDDFEWTSLNGEEILYNLPGYRAVQVLSIGFDDSEAEELAADLMTLISEGDETKTDAQESLDNLYVDIEDTAKSCKELLDGGEDDFESLMLQYGEDEGMTDPELRERGYYIGKTSLYWPEAVTNAVAALEKPGDVTDVLRTGDGVVIMRYIGDVQPGEVPLDQVRTGIEQEALEVAQNDARQKKVDEWIEAANVKYYLDRMQ